MTIDRWSTGIVATLLSLSVARAQQVVTFRGKVAGPTEGHTVYLYNKITSQQDSARIGQGTFTLTIPFVGPTRYLFYTSYDRRVKRGYTPFGILVETLGTVDVSLDITRGFAASARVTGSPAHAQYEQFLKTYETTDSVARPRFFTQFIEQHRNAYVAPFVLQRYGSDFPVSVQEKLLNTISPAYQTTFEAKTVRQALVGLQNAALGNRPRDFSLPNEKGVFQKLSDFRGKYVLLDFWASWCGPCHAEFPQLKHTYATYQAKGFEIWGISTDRRADAWLRDVQKQQLPWPQVRDSTSSVSNGLFGVSALPSSFLLDPQGRIIAKNLHGQALTDTLAVLLGQKKAVLTGKIGKLNPPATLFLSYNHIGQYQRDSVRLTDGAFRFELPIDEPVFATLFLSHDGRNRMTRRSDLLTLYLESGEQLLISPDSIKHARLPQNRVNLDHNTLEDSLRPVDQQRNRVFAQLMPASTPPARRDSLDRELVLLDARRKAVFRQFIASHPNSVVSLDALYRLDGGLPDYHVSAPLYNGLSEAVRQMRAGRAYGEKLNSLAGTAVGVIAPDFTQPAPDGKPVRLSDFRGKYVLLDFWASWCGPCRQENPVLVDAYAKYAGKGFTILGVSLDRKNGRQAWLNAIQKDGLTWPQVSELNYPDNSVARLYEVTAIPHNVLIDPQGRIVGQNLFGKHLTKKLAELLSLGSK